MTGPCLRSYLGPNLGRSYWIPGSYAPPWSEKRTSLLKAIEKEGLQGGKGDNNWVGRPRHIHDPGIQQERMLFDSRKGYQVGSRCHTTKANHGDSLRKMCPIAPPALTPLPRDCLCLLYPPMTGA